MNTMVSRLVRATTNLTIFNIKGTGNSQKLEDEYGTARHELEDEIERLTEAAIIGEKMWTPAELHEFRQEAFFQGWEMCSTAGAEDTCADAWAFWSMMEDGRDEAEGRK